MDRFRKNGGSLKIGKFFYVAAGLVLTSGLASAGVSYTCAANIDTLGPANTCNTLNTTIAALYGNTFSNANDSLYIQYGITGLGESTTGFFNTVSYSTYVTALKNEGGPGAVRAAAIASLPSVEPSIYGGGQVEITSALGEALGIGGLTGTTANGTACFTPGVGGCYNGIITISTPANLAATTGGQGLYYRNGVQGANDYDFFTVVEHETDETLGTSSCIDTQGATLQDDCGGTAPAAVDLYRYNGGNRVLESTTPGAYFSYNGGVSNGADGADYNTLSNGDDYADFATNCAHVQDATGCLGQSFDITTDGGSEINILDAVGFNLKSSVSGTPEPASLLLVGSLLGLGIAVSRRKPARRASDLS